MATLSGQLQVSDSGLFSLLATDTTASASIPSLLVETYGEYKELHKEHIAWVKHYLIAAALLLASQFNAVKDLGVSSATLELSFIPLAALLYMTVSAMAFTNFELKMRVYRQIYDAELSKLDPGSRLATLMRYPVAFVGPAFTAPSILKKTHLISTKDYILSMPSLIVIFLGKIILAGAAIYAAAHVFSQVAMADQYGWMRYVVLAAFMVSLIFSKLMLRRVHIPHTYVQR